MPIDAFETGLRGQELKRRMDADAALQAAYGDVSGNPEAYASLQQTNQKRALEPYAIPAAQADLASSQANTAATQQKTTGDIDDRRRDALLRGALAVDNAITSGQDWRPVLKHAGELLKLPPEYLASAQAELERDPASIKSTIAALQNIGQPGTPSTRYTVSQDPEGNLSRINATGAAEPIYNPDGTRSRAYQAPVAQQNIEQRDRLAAPTLRGEQAKAVEVGKKTGERDAKDLGLSETDKVKANTSLEGANQQLEIANKAIDSAINNTGWLTAGPASALPDFLNPLAADLRADLDTTLAQVVPDAMNQMRAAAQAAGGSGTGFGQLVNKELDLLKARYGATLQSSTPGKLKTTLSDLKTEMARVNRRINNEYTKMQRARGQAPAEAAPTENAPAGGQIEGNNVGVNFVRDPATGKLKAAQ